MFWLIREEKYKISQKTSPPKINEPDLNSRLKEDDEASSRMLEGKSCKSLAAGFEPLLRL